MSTLTEELLSIVAHEPSIMVQTFGQDLDAAWFAEACTEANQLTVRRRKMPTDEVIWLVIGMALWRDKSIGDVARSISLAKAGQGVASRIADSSVVEARQRCGPQPLARLFSLSSQHWQERLIKHEELFHGMRRFALDGTTLFVADSEDNREHFGGPSNQHGDSGYPALRLAMLAMVSSHLVVDAKFGPYVGKGSGENSLVRRMPERLPDFSLLLFDAGLFNSAALWAHQSAGTMRHWLGRIRSSLRFKVITRFAQGDELVRFRVPAKTRRDNPEMPLFLTLRLLTGKDREGKKICLLTSLIEAEQYSAEELWHEYSERWEIELVYREEKTCLLRPSQPLRSQKVEGVYQEMWGILLAYNLIRCRMAVAAAKVGLKGRHISFKKSLWNISIFCTAMLWTCVPSKLGQLLERLDEAIGMDVLPPRRKGRSYPRVVKAQKKRYPIKKTTNSPRGAQE